ncbi:MAG TPA: hypothetical protein VGM23_00700 [Armatimonadota bacterium]|jgi:hypothetical protein
MYYDATGQQARRERWYASVREHIYEWIRPDGAGVLPQFDAPYREPVWILPALYSGSPEYIDLANRMVGRYHDVPAIQTRDTGVRSGQMYNVFQTNCFSVLYHAYRHLLTPAADAVMHWHVEQAVKTYAGSGQPDFVFRGCNDNMPAHSTCGILLAGQTLGDDAAVEHARWNLRQLRQLLARNAWMSEFNSSTYSALTLTAMAEIASAAEDEEIRELALGIEHRLWAEVLLHYHPGTKHQAGPMSRAYCVDYAGHNHSLQLLLWLAFGEEATGRDPLDSYFHPDEREVVHFCGCRAQNIAEFTNFVTPDLHIPKELAGLITERQYPAVLRGRAESNHSFEGGAQIQTETYMDEAFSLGTCNRPMCGGEQTASLYLTYRRTPEVHSFRDATTAFFRYRTDDTPMGIQEPSVDGGFTGERFLANQAWCYTSQRANTAVLLCTPNLRDAPIEVSVLKLNLLFPAHFGQITASIIGDGPVREGAVGESADVAPVSIEAGEVFIHVQPLLPTNLPRRTAVRFSRQEAYEVLEMVNYEGEPHVFTRLELSRVLNGMVVTVDAKCRYSSLEAFHREKSAARVVDYLFVGMRYFEFQRADVWFRLCVSTDTIGMMTDLVDGLPRPTPILESNQIDVARLPFLGERSTPNVPFFPWEKMEIMEWANSWLIGSRGLPEEAPYNHRVESLVPEPDGPRRALLPAAVAKEDKRRKLAEEIEEDGSPGNN